MLTNPSQGQKSKLECMHCLLDSTELAPEQEACGAFYLLCVAQLRSAACVQCQVLFIKPVRTVLRSVCHPVFSVDVESGLALLFC